MTSLCHPFVILMDDTENEHEIKKPVFKELVSC